MPSQIFWKTVILNISAFLCELEVILEIILTSFWAGIFFRNPIGEKPQADAQPATLQRAALEHAQVAAEPARRDDQAAALQVAAAGQDRTRRRAQLCSHGMIALRRASVGAHMIAGRVGGAQTLLV